MNCKEAAVFIDLENLRYGMLNNFGQEPDISAIVEKAKEYGRLTLMKAYADFAEHPKEIQDQLHIAGIEAINVPVKRRTAMRNGAEVERVKNAADMFMALDAVAEAVRTDSAEKRKTFVLVTGDGDFTNLVTHLKNTFGQIVAILSVPGTVAPNLQQAADYYQFVPVPAITVCDDRTVRQALVTMVKAGPAPLRYWTLKLIDQWAQDARQKIPGTPRQRRNAIGQLGEEGVFTRYPYTDANTSHSVQAVSLNEERARELNYI